MSKAVKIAGVLVLVVICIVVTAGFVIRSGKKGNPSPESINMGSAGSMGPMPPAAHTSEQPESKEAKSPANTVSVDDLGLAPSNGPVKSFAITAEVVKKAGQSELWTYNGTVPGPEIRVTEGDHVHVTLINHLPVPTSIHWHGIAVPNRSDGVAGLTQDAVKPGQSYTYDFIAAEPGTYWYHSHTNTFEQEPRGLFAALIIEPRNRSRYDHDYTLVYFDDYNKSQTAGQIVWQRIQQSFGREVPPPVMVNGKEEEELEAARGQTVRVRIINASAGDMQGTPLRIVPLGAPFQVVALDGHDIHQPQTLSSEVLSIGQGQRYDLVFTVPSSGIVEVVNAFSGQVTSIGQGNLSIPKNLNDLPIFDLTSSGVPVLSALAPDARFDANYTVTLGSKPGFRFGQIELIHTMNGGAFPDSPTLVVEKGQMVHVRLENKSAEYHPIHLHGHVLTVLRVNDRPVTGSPVRQDTVLVYPHQTADVAFVADNPGLWMMHCHVLIHANFGMDMMVVYPNISTPYTIGTKSGNFPD